MTDAELDAALAELTPEERAEIDALIAEDIADMPWRPLDGPQRMAYESQADIIGYGGAAGGGKTDLICGKVQTQHRRSLVVRREKAQTEGVIQRQMAILGTTDGFNSQKSIWRLPGSRICEFAGLDNPGDERRWQGRDHGLKAFDEVTEMREQQVRFVMGWNRTSDPNEHAQVLMTFNPPTTSEGRWVIDFFGPWLNEAHPLYPTPPGALRYAAMLPDGNGGSKDRWVDSPDPFVLINGEPFYDFDPKSYKPTEIIKPKSRTFIPSRLTDNPFYMATGYMSTLQALPEPLRSQMLNGDFNAGVEDSQWQVIPTEWVELAQARWTALSPKPPMDSIGLDVARGGKDNTVLIKRHGWWFDKPVWEPGKSTPNGPMVAALAIGNKRDDAVIHIDVIGVGASPYDFLVNAKQDVIGVNVSHASQGRDKSGMLEFKNLRSELIWRAREAFDPEANNGIAIPPDPRLKADLCAFTWTLQGRAIYVEGREEVEERIGRSPDWASAFFLALMDTPKKQAMIDLMAGGRSRSITDDYDPMACMQKVVRSDYDPTDHLR